MAENQIPVGDDAAFTAYKTIEARRRKTRRNRIIASVVIGALVLGALGWFTGTRLMAPPEDDMPSFDLGVATIDDFESSVSASGSIQPASQVVVTPEVEGIIQDIRVAEGDLVAKDDLLFSLRNNSLDSAVQDAEQAVKTAENGLTSAQNALVNANNSYAKAQDNYNRVFNTLYETQEEADEAGDAATDALNAAASGVESAELALEDANIAVTKANEALDQARETADKRYVKAPEGGTVITMSAETGASVGGSSATGSATGSLVTIADLSSLRVRVEVNEVDINNLKEGQEAEVTFSALPDLSLRAVVERIAATSAGNSEEAYGGGGIVTYDVDLVIPNPDPQVKPGMTARVKILTEKIVGGLTIPAAALSYTDDTQTQAVVQVATYSGNSVDPIFEERSVSVVASDGSTAVVEGDLIEGEEVQLIYNNADEDDLAWGVAVG